MASIYALLSKFPGAKQIAAVYLTRLKTLLADVSYGRYGKDMAMEIRDAAKYVCHWDPAFVAYLAKKRAEGKHYSIALSHAAKKLVRLIFALEKSGQPYCPAI